MEAFKTLRPWFRLVRVPNLLTVPGDALAGFLLAGATMARLPRTGLLVAAAGAVLCLYIFGLILNDIVDVAVDTRDRPERPLPAGKITVGQARMAAIAMALSGLNLALFAGRVSLLVAAALGGLIIAYNAILKHRRVAGVVCMGLCRGASLLVGAAAACPEVFWAPSVRHAPVWIATTGLTLYVTGFSEVARHETEPAQTDRQARWLPFLALLLTLPILLSVAHALVGLDQFTPTIYVFCMVMVLMRSWLLGGIMYRCQPVPQSVGGHIRNLLMVQACFCLAAGQRGWMPALTLVLLSVVFRRLSRSFYSS